MLAENVPYLSFHFGGIESAPSSQMRNGEASPAAVGFEGNLEAAFGHCWNVAA